MATIYGMYAMRQGEAGVSWPTSGLTFPDIRNGNGVQVAYGIGQYREVICSMGSVKANYVVGFTSSATLPVCLLLGGVHIAILESTILAGITAIPYNAQVINHTFGYAVARWEIEVTPTTVTVWRNGVNLAEFTINSTPSDIAIVLRAWYNAGAATFFHYTQAACDVTISDVRLGDVHVAYLLPNGNGASSEWLGSDGNSTNNYQLVDEHPASATDYVGTGTTGKKDSYQMSNLPAAAASVLAVQPLVFAFKSDTGAEPSVSYVLRESGGTEATGAVAGIGTTMAGVAGSIHHTRPSGGAWSVSDVNSMEAGITT